MFPIPQMFVLPPAQGAIGGMVMCPFGSALAMSLLVGLLLSAAFGVIWTVIRRQSPAREGFGDGPADRSATDDADREAA